MSNRCPGRARQRVSAAARARVDAAVSVASSVARILAGDGPAAGVAARTNCPVVLSRGIGPAGEVQRKRRAEVCETEQRSATKTYRRPADQKLSFINHSKCIARICLLFSSRIESLPYYLLDKPTNGLQKNGYTFVDPGDEWRESD